LKDKEAEYYNNFGPDKFVTEMDEAGVDKAVMFGLDIERILSYKIPDDHVYESWVKKYPDKIIGFSTIDPIDSQGNLNRRGLKEFEKAIKEYGFRGLKLGPVYGQYELNDRRVYPFYEKALEFELPIMFHMGASVVKNFHPEYGRPGKLADVALDFPELKLIAAHMAFPWHEELFAIMRNQTNIYTDISGLCQIGLRSLTSLLVTAKERGLMDWVMFGTDTVCLPMKHYIEWCKTGINSVAKSHDLPAFSTQDIDKLMGENARRLLHL
jgi:predicted TIM-barrel fold metal-dependent hydrolase